METNTNIESVKNKLILFSVLIVILDLIFIYFYYAAFFQHYSGEGWEAIGAIFILVPTWILLFILTLIGYSYGKRKQREYPGEKLPNFLVTFSAISLFISVIAIFIPILQSNLQNRR